MAQASRSFIQIGEQPTVIGTLTTDAGGPFLPGSYVTIEQKYDFAAAYDSRLMIASCYATWEPDPDHPEWPEGRSDWSALALVDDLARLQRTEVPTSHGRRR